MGGLWLWQTSHSHCLYTDHHLVWEDFGCDKLVFLSVYTLITTLYGRTLAVTIWSFSVFIHWSPHCKGGLWRWQSGLSECLYTDHHIVWEDFGCNKYEQGERCTSYFVNLQKQKSKHKMMTTLATDDGTTINKHGDIINETTTFLFRTIHLRKNRNCSSKLY